MTDPASLILGLLALSVLPVGLWWADRSTERLLVIDAPHEPRYGASHDAAV